MFKARRNGSSEGAKKTSDLYHEQQHNHPYLQEKDESEADSFLLHVQMELDDDTIRFPKELPRTISCPPSIPGKKKRRKSKLDNNTSSTSGSRDVSRTRVDSTVGSRDASALFVESLSPRDLAKLANLLRPVLISQQEVDITNNQMDPLLPKSDNWKDNGDDSWRDDRDDSEWHNPYSENTHSLFYLCSVDSLAFCGNRLNMPPNVDLIVTIAQGVALFQALAFQSDFLEVVLAKAGFVGNRLQSAANDVVNFQVRKPAGEQGFLQRSWKAGIFLLILVVMVAGWITIVAFRTSGKFMCNTIIVNMGDNFVPSLGAFNGIYDLDFSTGSGLEWRAEYVERRSVEIDTPGRCVFGYCNDINKPLEHLMASMTWISQLGLGWSGERSMWRDALWKSTLLVEVFLGTAMTSMLGLFEYSQRKIRRIQLLVTGLQDLPKQTPMISQRLGESSGLSVMKQTAKWSWNRSASFVSTVPMKMRKEVMTVAVKEPAAMLSVTVRMVGTGSGVNLSAPALGSTLMLGLISFTLVEAYHRPVYIHEYESGDFDVVMFTGGRWALTSSVFLPYAGRIPSYELSDGHDDVGSDIGNYFKHAFHGYKGFSTNLSVAFLSDYMERGTHLSSSSPVGFSWFFAEEAIADNQNQGIGNEISTEFLCRACDESSNPCLYDGKCSDGACVCSLDSFGSLCEIPPGMFMGLCLYESCASFATVTVTPFFNTPEFKMDGGDCCESTCVSTSQYACGAEKDGYVSTGYFYCEKPNDEWQSSHFNGDAGSFSGFALLQDRVRIYDKVGSSWVLRDTILGSPNTYFGTGVLGLSSGPFNVVNNPSFRAPLTVAVQDGFRTLRIYKCNFDGCSQSQAIELVHGFALSDDGTVLATSLFVPNEPIRAINVYKTVDGIFQMRDTVVIQRNTTASNLLSMALSSEGDRLAVQTQMTDFDEASNFEVVTDENVVVMAWNESSSAYKVETDFRFATPRNTLNFPLPLSFNHNGNVLAYGFPECESINIKEISGELGWANRTAPSLNTTACVENKRPDKNNALALSGDGDRIAFRVGTKVGYFHWESENWNPIGDPFPLIHYPVAMSSDGTELAIGSPKDGIGGVTTVYTLPRRKQCPSGMSLLRLSLTLDRLPGDVVWSLVNNRTGEVLFQQDSYPQEYTFATSLEETCVPTDSCYVFTIYNKRNRGLLAPGSYAIFMDGENVAQGTVGGLFAREQFGSCASCPAGTEQFSMMMLTCGPMEWVVFNMVDQGDNYTALHYDSTYGSYSRGGGNTTAETLEVPSNYQTCFDHDMDRDCRGKSIPVSLDACLDPVECYGVNVISPLRYTAYLELVFGEETVNVNPSAVCDGGTSFLGKCPQEADSLI
ncbi:unknown protein [Seminavis robusta]|uniref:EGF-like domain-containing protein n=1 Tax=Seminavis robusta TaxID=568900 RepID=A0A9N8EZ69_9STRA|nr:unknown protein [Seminavis robusta]